VEIRGRASKNWRKEGQVLLEKNKEKVNILNKGRGGEGRRKRIGSEIDLGGKGRGPKIQFRSENYVSIHLIKTQFYVEVGWLFKSTKY
jgi:hypothetical protein